MSTIIYGRNAVRASIEAKRARKVIALKRLEKEKLISFARENGVDVQFVEPENLTRMTGNPSHQGFAAIVEDYRTVELEEVLSSKNEYPLLLMLDGIEDPHNLGAIIRTADAFNVDGIIIKRKGNVPLNATVAKVSTGAINYVKVAEVTNLSRTIEELKKKGYWIVATDGEAKMSYKEIDYKCPIVLIVGSEGYGISRLLLEKSDFLCKIPMFGHVNSLNASVATAIFVSNIVSSR